MLAAHRPAPAFAAPVAAAPPPPPPPALDPAAGVPDIVEDRRTDSYGNVVVRSYQRGRLLGKVRAPPRSARRRGCPTAGGLRGVPAAGCARAPAADCASLRLCRPSAVRRPRFFSPLPPPHTHTHTRHATGRPLPPRPTPRQAQGGFARCFKFLNREKNRTVAGKVVDKETLHKARAKSKVRRRAPPAAVCPTRQRRPPRPAAAAHAPPTPRPPRPAAAGGDQDPPQRVPQVHCGVRLVL